MLPKATNQTNIIIALVSTTLSLTILILSHTYFGRTWLFLAFSIFPTASILQVIRHIYLLSTYGSSLVDKGKGKESQDGLPIPSVGLSSTATLLLARSNKLFMKLYILSGIAAGAQLLAVPITIIWKGIEPETEMIFVWGGLFMLNVTNGHVLLLNMHWSSWEELMGSRGLRAGNGLQGAGTWNPL